jgi:hypothetical protein
MSVIKNDLKKSFKIVLDSSKTNFTGNQFDANFQIDLTKILTNDKDFDKSYNMTFAFRSRGADPNTTLLDYFDVYTLCIDFGKGYNSICARMNRNHVGILPVSINTVYGSVSSFFDAKESDNAPILVKNVRDLTSIRLTVVENTIDLIFNPTNDNTINNLTEYVCILTFTEI